MAIDQVLVLDSALRDWVLLPILGVMMLVGVLRHYVSELLITTPKPLPLKEVREQRALQRAALLRAAGHHLPTRAAEQRRRFLIDNFLADAYLAHPENKGQAPPNPLTDPSGMDGMMNMLKGNLVNMVPQMGLMAWVNFFFSGFVLLKLPFPLTLRFKQMLQSGVATRDLDVTWVSSLSWYFLNLFGLQPFYALVLGEAGAQAMADMASGMGGMGMGGAGGAGPMQAFGPGQDPAKLFAAEVENLEVATFTPVTHGIAARFTS